MWQKSQKIFWIQFEIYRYDTSGTLRSQNFDEHLLQDKSHQKPSSKRDSNVENCAQYTDPKLSAFDKFKRTYKRPQDICISFHIVINKHPVYIFFFHRLLLFLKTVLFYFFVVLLVRKHKNWIKMSGREEKIIFIFLVVIMLYGKIIKRRRR